MSQEIESLKQKIYELETQVLQWRTRAEKDDLTGCLRREAFRGLLEQRERMGHLQHSGSLLVVDIDHFKRINDTQGHAQGDVVLKKVAEVLKLSAPHDSLVARFGGEEFVLYVPGEMINAVLFAEVLRVGVEHAVGVTISVGVARLSSSSGFQMAYESADEALYSAKEGGRIKLL